jgi:hypothetical protein
VAASSAIVPTSASPLTFSFWQVLPEGATSVQPLPVLAVAEADAEAEEEESSPCWVSTCSKVTSVPVEPSVAALMAPAGSEKQQAFRQLQLAW